MSLIGDLFFGDNHSSAPLASLFSNLNPPLTLFGSHSRCHFSFSVQNRCQAWGKIFVPQEYGATEPRRAIICAQDWLRKSHEPINVEEYFEELETIELEISGLSEEYPIIDVE